MIRTARATDVPAMVEVLRWGAERCEFYGRLTFDAHEARSLLFQLVQRHGKRGLGGTCIFVSEHDGKVEGLIAGVVNRFYEVAVELEASDVWWICTDRAPVRDGVALFAAFTKWAESNPKVRIIRPGVSRLLGEPERKEKVLAYYGYRPYGSVYLKEKAA